MIRTIAILALFVACVQARNVTFKNCSPTGKINWVTVDPCSAEPCVFQPDKPVTIEGELVSASDSDHPQLILETEVLGVMIPYPRFDSDACKYLTCPLKANVVTPFKIPLNTDDLYPAGDNYIQLQLKGSDGTKYNCAIIDILIAG